MQNSILMFNFSVLDWKYSFYTNSVRKKQIFQFKLKFGTKTNLNIQNSMLILVFSSILDRKFFFLEDLLQKTKIISLSCIFLQKLVRIQRIYWSYFHFLFLVGNALGISNFCYKIRNYLFKLKFGTKTTSNTQN